jgi:hypothetical protein
MTELSREQHLEQIHLQLQHLQDNLASRVAGEAEALDVEIDKLHDHELEEAQQLLRTAHAEVLAGCDIVRDLRRGLHDRQPAI